jgi:RHS repeat-associated protein
LGNVRLIYFNNGPGAEVLEENSYYPFGLKHEGYNALAGNPTYNYKYNGKELQQESGMYDYGARFYMPDIGRWEVVDPLAEQYHAWSPYNYVFNNPISNIDPDGRAPLTDFKLLKDGTVTRVDPNDGSENNKNDRLFVTDDKGKITNNSPFVIKKEKATDTTMITDLSQVKSKTRNGDLRYTESGKIAQALDLYQFVALNSTSEWSFENHGSKAIFGTFQNDGLSPNFSSGNYAIKGYSESTLIYDIHSHGSIFGTNGPSSAYSKDINSDLSNDVTKTRRRYLFRTNGDKPGERGTMWRYGIAPDGRRINGKQKVPGNYLKNYISENPEFNK